MNTKEQESIAALQDIKKMMEQSSRFVSLSGLSGIAAGITALISSVIAHKIIFSTNNGIVLPLQANYDAETSTTQLLLNSSLFMLAMITLAVALSLAFIFTYLRSKKHSIPLWGTSAKRLTINTAIPLLAGGFFILKLIETGNFGFIAPGCLIFYGLALVNASKYTLGEIRYLGYCQILLGMINLLSPGYGLYFWAAGFGVLHILYGLYMWNKYERA